jgi:NAD(P)H dehydrogenase (quinone)
MYVIFGATGRVGSATVAALRRAGKPVRAVVRDDAKREALERVGCDVVTADLLDEASVTRALDGAHGVQMLCPVPHHADDPAAAMHRVVDTTARVLNAHRHLHVVALSDYGAELESGSGITMLFHHLEAAFRRSVPTLTLLRSAEHMHNWARVLPVALAKGVLPSMHHPLDRPFPTVAASDVGMLSARLLIETPAQGSQRVISIEGPQRYTANDIARAFGEAAGREIAAHRLPREDWDAAMARAGLNARHAALITELYDAQNAGRIDVEAGAGQRYFGATTLQQALGALVAATTTA